MQGISWVLENFCLEISPDIVNVVEYLCVEFDVRTNGIHDNLLCDSAFVTDPEGEAYTAS